MVPSSVPVVKPPFNDALYRALSPTQAIDDQQVQHQNVNRVLKKYGRGVVPSAPKSQNYRQMMGDNHG